MAEPSVRIPGIVLASLMFQHVNSDSDVVRDTFMCFKGSPPGGYVSVRGAQLANTTEHICPHYINKLFT